MQSYLIALSECFKCAAIYDDKMQTGHVAKVLELSMQPSVALDYFKRHQGVICHGVDTMFVQDIESYLKNKAAS